MIDPTTFTVLEQTTPKYTGQIVAEDGVTPIPAATLLTFTLTLYVILTDGSISYVNGRNAQNVLNANNVTVSALGEVVWSVQVADTTLVEAVPFERHVALFEWTWPTNLAGKHEVVLVVQNLTEV